MYVSLYTNLAVVGFGSAEGHETSVVNQDTHSYNIILFCCLSILNFIDQIHYPLVCVCLKEGCMGMITICSPLIANGGYNICLSWLLKPQN